MEKRHILFIIAIALLASFVIVAPIFEPVLSSKKVATSATSKTPTHFDATSPVERNLGDISGTASGQWQGWLTTGDTGVAGAEVYLQRWSLTTWVWVAMGNTTTNVQGTCNFDFNLTQDTGSYFRFYYPGNETLEASASDVWAYGAPLPIPFPPPT